MKQITLLIAALLMAIGFVSCKPKQSAYRAAYEKAKQRELAREAQNAADDEIKPILKTSESAAVVREKVSPAAGEDATGLRTYSVVIGSFQNLTNAKSLKERMISEGYRAMLAQNEMGMYRVIVASFDNKEDAVVSKEQIKARYQQFNDAWLLYRQ